MSETEEQEYEDRVTTLTVEDSTGFHSGDIVIIDGYRYHVLQIYENDLLCECLGWEP